MFLAKAFVGSLASRQAVAHRRTCHSPLANHLGLSVLNQLVLVSARDDQQEWLDVVNVGE